jgi:hypothetical protein
MNWKTTIAFLVIAIAIVAFYLQDVEKVEEEKELEKQKEELVLAEEKDIMQLTVERPGKPTVSAVREGENWNLTEPVQWPADKFAWDAVASSLASAKIKRTFPDEGETVSDEDLTKWGLNPAGLTVKATVREGSAEHTIGFGNSIPSSDSSVYATSSDLTDKVVVIPNAVISNASRDLYNLREKKYLNVHFERDKPTRIEVSNKDIEVVAEKGEGDAWVIVSPEQVKGEPATLRKYVEKLGLESIKIIDDIDEDKLAKAGLADDQLDSATKYKIGFGEEGTAKTFYVGKFDPTEGGHLGRREGTKNLFVVAEDFFKDQPKTLSELRPTRAIAIQKWTADVISATSNGNPLFSLAKEDFKWRMTSPHSATAERETVDKIVDAFNDYKITSYVGSASTDAQLGLEVPILSLSIGGEEKLETIHFGEHDGVGGIYAAWEGLPDRFVLDQGVLDQVLLNPLDLLIPAERDRVAPPAEESKEPELLDLTGDEPIAVTREAVAPVNAEIVESTGTPIEEATAEVKNATD